MNRRTAANGTVATTAAMFGELLRHFREKEALTQEDLARQIPCDRSHIARVEAGSRVPRDTFAAKCDTVLDTGGALSRLWEKIDWYAVVEHPDWFQRRADMDAELVELRAFQTTFVPGLLQTESYAWQLLSPEATGDDVNERVRARLSRQLRFLAPDGPTYLVVLDESCLRNIVGGAKVMREQCAHLLVVGERPNIRIQIAPSNSARLSRPATSMSLIRMPGGHEWVYSESLNHGHFSDDPTIYLQHSRSYDVLRADVLSAPDSAALISKLMEGYGPHGCEPAERSNMDHQQLQRAQRRRLRAGRHRFPRQRPRP